MAGFEVDVIQTITAVLAAFVAGFMLARRRYRPKVPTLQAPVRPDIPDAAIREKLLTGRRIEALRLLRAKHGYGVREAQRDADAMLTGSTTAGH